MTNHKLRPARAHGRARILGGVAALLLTLITATAAPAATVTKTGFAAGVPGFPTVPGGLGVFEAMTPVPPPDAVREVGTYDITVAADPAIAAEAPFAGSFKAYAVTDIRNHTDAGVPYLMELQLAADAWAGEFLPDVPAKLTWLLRNAEGLIAVEADTARAAAAVQIVVWQTLRNPQGGLLPRADLDTPSDDPAVNALAVKFTAVMEASLATAGDGTVAINLSAGPVDACSSTITITGTPGVPVTLTVDNGGVLSTRAVMIGDDGSATVTVTTAPGVTVTVTGQVTSGGVLVRADGVHDPDAHTTLENKSLAPEELIFLAGAQIAASSVPITCPAPPVVPPVVPLVVPPAVPPVVPSVAVSPTPPAGAVGTLSGTLRLTKAAPQSAVAGQLITYRIRVRNSSTVAVESVVLRDVLPAGMTLVRRPAGTTIKNGAVVWRVGTLAPGAQRVVALTVRLARTLNGRRCNTATASGANAPTVTARACSAIRAVAGTVRVPIVTG